MELIKAVIYEGASDAKSIINLICGKPVIDSLPKGIKKELVKVLADGKITDATHVVKEGETICIRILPADPGTWALIGFGLLAIGGVIGGISLSNMNAETERMNREIENLRKSMGQSSSVNLPWLKGASNAVATGQTKPYIIGEHLFTPYILNSSGTGRGYNRLAGTDGKECYYVAVLDAGFGKQKIKSMSVGESLAQDTFPSTYTHTEGTYNFKQDSVFYDPSNVIEVRQDGKPFLYDDFNRNIEQQNVSDKVPYHKVVPQGETETYTPLTYTIPKNSMCVDVGILINGLIAYGSDGNPTQRTVSVIPEYRIKMNGSWGNWTGFGFSNGTKKVTKKVHLKHRYGPSENSGNHMWWELINDKMKYGPDQGKSRDYVGPSYLSSDGKTITISKQKVLDLVSNNGDDWFTVESDSAYIEGVDGINVIYNNYDSSLAEMRILSSPMTDCMGKKNIEPNGKNYKQCKYSVTDVDIEFSYEVDESSITSFTGQTKNQLRYNAHADFSPSAVIGAEEIQIRVSSDSNEYTAGSCYDDVYVQWIQSQPFDTEQSTSSAFFPEPVVNAKEASLSTLIGIRIKSTQANQDKLTKINLVSQGLARVWSSTDHEWSQYRIPTRNPASWLLEVLTSGTHLPSKVSDGEIDLESFGELYEWCETEGKEIHCDMVLVRGETKENVLKKILTTCYSTLYRTLEGKIAVATDKTQDNAIALLNPQNLISFKWTRENRRRTDGINIKHTDHSEWLEDTTCVTPDGRTVTGSQTEGMIFRDMTVDGIEEHKEIVRYGRYLMASDSLRPHKVTATVGMEGTFFTPYSKVLVQHPSLGTGLGHARIKGVTTDGSGNITALELYQDIILDGESEYNIIVQCTSTSSDMPVPAAYEIENTEGRTRVIILSEPIDSSETVKPMPGDVLSWGYDLETVTTPYTVLSVEPAGQGRFTLSLTDYNEAIYDEGDIPEYVPHLSKRLDPVTDEVPDTSLLFREYAKKSDVDAAGVNWLGNMASEPANPSKNDAYRNTTDGKSYIWDGTQWSIMTEDGEPGTAGEYTDFQFAVGAWNLTQEQLLLLTWYDAPPATTTQAPCLYMASKKITPQ